VTSNSAIDPEILTTFEETGAILEGHFQLASGLHADRYVEKFNLLQWPDRTAAICARLAAVTSYFRPETVAGPTTGGIILAYEVARQLGLRGIIAERNSDGPGRTIQRDFKLASEERVLIVDDVVTSGGSVQDTIEAVLTAGGKPIAVAVLVDRSGGMADFGLPFFAAATLEFETFEPDHCPFCVKKVPLTIT
jgi:orotate phosphoribosyltransferase